MARSSDLAFVQRVMRRAGSHAERRTHIRLARLLDYYLDHSRVFWTSIENRPVSAVSGKYQKLMGVRAGVPDVLVFYRGETGIVIVWVELKSRSGSFTTVQHQVCKELLAAGALYFAARSARAVLAALLRAGVPFRHEWQEPDDLALWEGPVTSSYGLKYPPEVMEAHRLRRRRYVAEERERRAAARAAAQEEAGPAGNRNSQQALDR